MFHPLFFTGPSVYNFLLKVGNTEEGGPRRRLVRIRIHFYIVGLSALFALEVGAAAPLRLLPSHMHYLKSCFALERGDVEKAREELRLACVLDEDSPYLRLAMQRHGVLPPLSKEQLRGELE